MNKKSKYIGIFLSLFMLISYLLPANLKPVYAEEGQSQYVTIIDIAQSQSGIQKDDIFSININYGVTDSRVEITNARVSGAGIEYINAPEISWSNNHAHITVNGLKYNGGSKSILVELEYTLNHEELTSPITGSVHKQIDLVAKTSEEIKDAIAIEGTKKIRVKAGKSQNAEFKVKNVSTNTINRVKIKPSMQEEISGIDIKNKDYIEITAVQPKEVRTIQFVVGVEEGVKAGSYKMNVEIAGTNYPMELIVDSNIMPPSLEVSLDSNRVFKAGIVESMMVKIQNVGDISAKNIRFEISNSSDIAVANGSSVRFIEEIKAGVSQSIPVSIKISSNTDLSMIPVKIDLKYLDEEGSERTESQYIYLNTSSGQASSEVVISNVIGPSGIYSVDQNFTVKFHVSSKTGAENIKVSVKGDEGIVPKSQNLFVIDKLSPGTSKQFTVTMAATLAASTNTHPIEISVDYGKGEGKNTINQYTSVNISNPESEKDEEGKAIKKGMPKVIVGTYSVNPVVVQAGQEFDLEIGFLNTNSTKSVHNFKANLTVKDVGENDSGNVFTPVGASNTFYIADLMPRQTEVKKIRLYTIPSASPRTYQIIIDMQYEDDKGTEITATESIGIPVEQVTKLEIADVVIDSPRVGMAAYMNAPIYNTGKTDITNIKVSIEGEGFTVQDGKIFIGRLEKGETTDYSPTIIPEAAGLLEGKIIIEYEDTTGKINTYIKEFSVEVAEAMEYMPEDMGMEQPIEEEQKSIVVPLIIGSVLLIVVIVVVIIVLKRKKAKKEKMMMDEDF